MPTYTLRGVAVDFPYNAYECQVRVLCGERERGRTVGVSYRFVF